MLARAAGALREHYVPDRGLVKPTGSFDNARAMVHALLLLLAIVLVPGGAHAQGLRHFRDAHAASQRGEYRARLDADDPHAPIYRGLVYCERREP